MTRGFDGSPISSLPPEAWLLSNGSAFAIADLFPVSAGHTLVLPRRVIRTWWEATAEERVDLWSLVDEVKVLWTVRTILMATTLA